MKCSLGISNFLEESSSAVNHELMLINHYYILNKVSLNRKDLNNEDNHNSVMTHLEPDILEWEVKWALGSIIMNKASGGDGIPAEPFQILKDDAV